MGWFTDDRTKAEQKELEKYKPKKLSRKTKRSISTAAKRQRSVEKYQTKADVYRDVVRERKAKEELKKQKRLAKGLPATKKKIKKKKGYGYVLGTPIKKKKQTRTISRKSRIRLI